MLGATRQLGCPCEQCDGTRGPLRCALDQQQGNVKRAPEMTTERLVFANIQASM